MYTHMQMCTCVICIFYFVYLVVVNVLSRCMCVCEACDLVLRAALLEQIADCVNYYAPRYAPALCERTVRLYSVHSRCSHTSPSIDHT